MTAPHDAFLPSLSLCFDVRFLFRLGRLCLTSQNVNMGRGLLMLLHCDLSHQIYPLNAKHDLLRDTSDNHDGSLLCVPFFGGICTVVTMAVVRSHQREYTWQTPSIQRRHRQLKVDCSNVYGRKEVDANRYGSAPTTKLEVTRKLSRQWCLLFCWSLLNWCRC